MPDSSRPINWPKQGRNVVLFPRKYYIDPQTEKKSYVEGVSFKNRLIRIYLRLHPLYIKQIYSQKDKVPPKLSDFARTDRFARKACIATPQNGPGENRAGILLFSKVFPIEGVKNHFEARWCVVLANDEHSLEPSFGIGRMEVDYGDTRFETDEIKAAKLSANRLRQELLQIPRDHEEYPALEYKLSEAEDRLREIRPMRFRAISDQLSDIRTVKKLGKPLSRKILIQSVSEAIADYTKDDGRYGGVLIRCVHSDNTVVLNKCAKIALRFKADTLPVPAEVAKEFFDSRKGHALLSRISDDDILELIPFMQTNCGPSGNSMYRKKKPYKTIQKTFFTPDMTATRDCQVALRLVRAPSNGNLLLGSIYATSAPIGNILTLNGSMQPVYKIA